MHDSQHAAVPERIIMTYYQPSLPAAVVKLQSFKILIFENKIAGQAYVSVSVWCVSVHLQNVLSGYLLCAFLYSKSLLIET